MSASRKTIIVITTATALLAIGFLVGWWLANRQHDNGISGSAAPAEQKKVLYWYDPMYPQQHFDQPGKSPFMDMELVPRYADHSDNAEARPAAVQIDPRVAQNLGIRTATVTRMPRHVQIDAAGRLMLNERDVAIEQARSSGFVERVWPLAPGDHVKKGQPLVALRVPEWSAAQQEWLAVQSSGDAALIGVAGERLLQLGLSEAHVHELERTRAPQTQFVVTASKSGVLESLDVRAGMTLMAGQTLARINGLATVWLEIAVPQARAREITVGAPVTVTLPGINGETLTAQVSAIVPTLKPDSLSLRLRVELPNTDGRLHPGMSAQVQLRAGSDELALAIPTEALIRTGKRTLVMRAEANNQFVPVEVVTGAELDEHTVIVAGLTEGQQIVVSGQFLIDSEASVSGVAARASAGSLKNRDEALATLHQADATVEAIDDDQITLAHGPFTALHMPGMTMTFTLATVELVRDIKRGDHVRVGLRETKHGLVVEQLEKLITNEGFSGAQP